MLRWEIYCGGVRKEFDLHALEIGGRSAEKLSGDELCKEMKKIGITDISPLLGWTALAMKLAQHQQSERDKLEATK